MSSVGFTVEDGGLHVYFCHQCERPVTITPCDGGDILCPSCNSGFVQEFQNPNPNSSTPTPLSLFITEFFLPFINESSSPDPDRPDPFVLAPHLSDLIVEYIGIGERAENDLVYGTPPASKSAVEALPSVEVDEALLKWELAMCAVCKDDFEMGAVVKLMPCKHVYHQDCILPWLELHNSCPMCRYELPTDDPDNESRGNSGRSGVSPASDVNNNGDDDLVRGSDGERTVESRFTATLPWLSGSNSSGEEAEQRNRELH